MARFGLVDGEFPAGEYYIGDLCYVMHPEWDEFCSLTIVGNIVLEGNFSLKDGRKFFFGCTAYGDGMYTDSCGRKYPVDAGLIGIISVNDITDTELKNLKSGNVVTFTKAFDVTAENGVFYFDDIFIDTSDDEDEDDYYNYDEEEYQEEYRYGEEDE
jgi:hypothetical protein